MPEAFRNDFRERIAADFAADLLPMPGVADVLGRLDPPFCLASSSDPGRLAVTLRAAGLTERFGGRVYSASQVAHGKPAPDLFLFAAESMRVAPASCLVVEDTVPGVLAGKAAGMTVWGFTGGSHCAGRDIGRKLGPTASSTTCRHSSKAEQGMDAPNPRNRASTRRRAPAGSISSPAIPRMRSPGNSRFRARRRSAWCRSRSASG